MRPAAVRTVIARFYSDHPLGVLVGGLLVCGLVVGGLFVVDVSVAAPNPVPFEDTRAIGFASEDAAAIDSDSQVPRAQVFYSQYQYVVGYYGIETAIEAIDEPTRKQQFGYPIASYVTAYDETGIELDADGTIQTASPPQWVDANEAVYVLGSDASTPAGPVSVPFADREAAATFAAQAGGRIVSWDDLADQEFETDDAALLGDQVDSQHAEADKRVDASERLYDREAVLELTPGEPVQPALDSAPNGSTVVLEPGTYEGPLEINRSITLRGAGATIDGRKQGTSVRVAADDVVIDGVTVTGVGSQTRDSDAATGDDDWDQNIELGYGHGDAGIAAVDAAGVVVTNVTVPHTDANGVLLRDSPDAVVRNLTVSGAADWNDGFMGVMVMRSPAVIEGSSFTAGRDGVYLHRSEGTVIRDNRFSDNRYGVHLMHTSGALLADNRFADQEFGGITIMTSPARNAIVDNVVTNTTNAISTSGSDSYIARNIATDSRVGITTSAVSSVYEHNVVRNNTYGMRTGSVLATSRVWKNDFVDNEHHARASAGPLRIWAHDGQGNHWAGIEPPGVGGSLERAYVPTDPVDGQLHRSQPRYTVADSPVTRGLRALRGAAPGLRSGSIMDPHPQSAPQNPARYRLSESVGIHGVEAPELTNRSGMTSNTDTPTDTSEAQP